SVHLNDTVNGVAVDPAVIVTTLVSDGGLTGVSVASDGTLAVPAAAPAGSYTVRYQICDPGQDPAIGCAVADATVLVIDATITLSKAEGAHTDVDGSGADSAGDTVAYQYAIAAPATNGAALAAIRLVDDKIGTLTVATPSSGDANGNGLLDPGETWLVTGLYTLVQADIDAGSVTNTAYAEGAAGSTTLQSNSDTVTAYLAGPPAPALALAKTWTFVTDANGDGKAGTGDVIRYAYAVTNTGNVAMANVSVSDVTNGNDPA
ncbi:hypothetical protein CSC94_23950, partial [Zhengella mangrovi]